MANGHGELQRQDNLRVLTAMPGHATVAVQQPSHHAAEGIGRRCMHNITLQRGWTPYSCQAYLAYLSFCKTCCDTFVSCEIPDHQYHRSATRL
jgi:hypothetical protein